jgi:anhydro-N-acetylmuramic acid kinase
MRVLGMISGTSHDGVDTALVDFSADGELLRGTVIAAGSVPYPDDLRARLLAALPPAAVPLAEVCALDTLLGQHFAQRAAAVTTGRQVDLICSHGQTVFHWVADGRAAGGLQLGQPAWIAEATGVPVLSDIRSRDIAAGGHGAPLVPILDTLLLGGLPGRSAALNLGGIANMTVLSAGTASYAYDLGPANALIDDAVRRHTGASYDVDGALAAAGTVDDALLAELLAEPYYRLPAPKSTGKELFHAQYLADHLGRHQQVGPVDVIATVTALTAEVVAADVRRAGVDAVVASGGGVANPTLMRMITDRLPGVAIRTTDEFGAPADTKEAIAFALIGYLSAHGLPGNVPSCTGASGPRILGGLVPGHAPLPTWPTVPVPRRLVLT